MAISKCEIIGSEQLNLVYGVGEVADVDLYITPNPGFLVSKDDFKNDTEITYPSTIGIIDSIELSNTTSAYSEGNQVKITVKFSPSYSITEDTTITIDINGYAREAPYQNLTLGIAENLTDLPYGTFTVTNVITGGTVTTQDHALDSLGATSDGYNEATLGKPKVHYINCDLPINLTPTKVATLVLNTVQDDVTTGIKYFGNFTTNGDHLHATHSTPTPTPHIFRPTYNIAHEHPTQANIPWYVVEVGTENVQTTIDASNTTNDEVVASGSGHVLVKKIYDLYYQPGLVGIGNDWSDNVVTPTNWDQLTDWYRLNVISVISEAPPVRTNPVITRVTTGLSNLPSGSSSTIPSGGITNSNAPTVKIYGTPGSTFSVKFRESKVVESTTGVRTLTGSVDYFDGIIPKMPTGVVTIPKSGIYSFKMPTIASFTTAGWKEFEMEITAGSNTIIKPSVKKTGGTSINAGSVGSIVTNKFYQYPDVDITFTVTKEGDWDYQGVYTSALQLPALLNGIPLMPPNNGSRSSKAAHTRNFEIRVRKSGTFSLNTSNTEAIKLTPVPPATEGVTVGHSFDKSLFTASVTDNGDIVSFSNLKAYIGEGTSDTDARFATITGTIRCSRFGYQNQTYTIDLGEIFTHA